jgi:hypothetical protein
VSTIDQTPLTPTPTRSSRAMEGVIAQYVHALAQSVGREHRSSPAWDVLRLGRRVRACGGRTAAAS